VILLGILFAQLLHAALQLSPILRELLGKLLDFLPGEKTIRRHRSTSLRSAVSLFH
jgi:hypothetical protein